MTALARRLRALLREAALLGLATMGALGSAQAQAQAQAVLDNARPASAYSANVATDWFSLALQLAQQTPGFSPHR